MTEKQTDKRLHNSHDMRRYQRTQMQKEMVLQKLKERGCRITRQRLMLLDIILEEECASSKEIYYRAMQIDDKIGTATVYRLINTLEEIGAISRKNMYKIECSENCNSEDACTVEFDDNTVCHLSPQKLNAVIQAGMIANGYTSHQKIRSVTLKQV